MLCALTASSAYVLELCNTYLQHIFTGEVVVMTPEQTETDTPRAIRYQIMAELYVLRDLLDDTRFRNDVLDSILDLYGTVLNYPSPVATRIAYSKVPKASVLRKLVKDFYTYYLDVEWLESNRNIIDPNFVFDIACARGGGEITQSTHPAEMPPCAYHEHNEEVPECRWWDQAQASGEAERIVLRVQLIVAPPSDAEVSDVVPSKCRYTSVGSTVESKAEAYGTSPTTYTEGTWFSGYNESYRKVDVRDSLTIFVEDQLSYHEATFSYMAELHVHHVPFLPAEGSCRREELPEAD
ncbi:hypothetical protein DOTSEDRAFT_80537 [Dothistroma septosporum NZE10]|uniref:BTB domain-containing protein n=1 Tax=Dothistroma septosporum (strain NZE10 / CBS 128990) TaxID=675120 RepID=M2WLS6_DOTSN|nr:hypothetical protein DOTSEDRAFT_80537 [Dothistroma septosporum NZE10]